MIFNIKKPKPKPVMKMITPGRRAYGEAWQEVTVAVDDDKVKVIENRPAEAPPGGKPIYVPGMGNLNMDAIDFLIEGARKSQEYGKKHPRSMSEAEFSKWLNDRWMQFAEEKLKWFKGQSIYGPGGFTQREVPERTHWSGADKV